VCASCVVAFPLSVHTVPTQVLMVGFMFPLGIGIALAVRLGATLPQSAPRAKQLTIGCYLASAVLFGSFAICMYVWRVAIFSVFTSEPEVIEGCERIWWKVCVYYFNLSVYGINMGISTGLGKQWMFGIVTFVFLWGLSLPAIYYFAIRGGGGLDMAWACIYQPYIAMNMYFLYAFWKEDWEAIRIEIRIREKMDDNSSQDDNEGEMTATKTIEGAQNGTIDETTRLL
jgi:Na+-driven multidrug efflux pump